MDTHGAVVVVGGGAGGHACVRAYREHGGEAPLTLIGADDRLPYFRPRLSKTVLTGQTDLAEIALDPAAWYRDHDVEVLLGTPVTALDLGERLVATANGAIGFDHLVLATGSSASTPGIPGADHPDALTLRSAADAERLLERADSARRVIVIGSGFIGCELAAALRSRGVEIAMAASEPAPQHDRLGAGVGALLAGWMRDLGIELLPAATVTGIDHRAGEVVVRLVDHEALEGDAVVLATGARPNVDLWRQVGGSGESIPVDATMRTDAPRVYAVGDIAEAFHPLARRRLRVEHWGDAVEMGQIAGAALAGHHASWTTVPGFWSEIGGRTVKYVAWGDGWDAWRERRSTEGVTFWFERDGEVAGVLTVDHDEDLVIGESLISRRAPIDDVR